MSRIIVWLVLIVLVSLAAACGGGSGAPVLPDPNPNPNPPADPPPADPPPADPPPADPPPATGTWLGDVYNLLPAEGSANRSFQTAAELATAAEILGLMNSERATAGLGPLTLDIHLERVAQAHGMDMAKQEYFAHTNLYDMRPWDRLDTINPPPYFASGENIAAGQPTSAAVMQGWMDSPGHRDNILNDVYTHVGIGVYRDPASFYNVYYVQMFATFPGDPNLHPRWYAAP